MRQLSQSTSLLIIFLLLACGFSSSAFATTIAGTITLDDGGHPAEHSFTFVLKTKESYTTSGCYAWGETFPTTTIYNQTDGAYTLSFNDLSTGTYYLFLDIDTNTNLVPEWSLGSDTQSSEDCNQAVATIIESTDTLTNFNFQMAPGGIISGIVGVAGSSETLADIQISALFIESDNACNNPQQRLQYSYSADDGTYTIMGIPLNKHIYFKAQPWGQNYFDKWYVNGGESTADCSQAQSVTFTTTIEKDDGHFFLSPGAIIRGTVIDSSTGAALPGIGIDLQASHDFSSAASACNTMDTTYLSMATTETDGSFFIQGLAPGTYMLLTSSDSTLHMSEYWADPNSVRSCTEGGLITTESGIEYPGKDFQLELGSSISGIITDSVTNTPIQNMHVSASTAATGDACNYSTLRHHSSSTIEDGSFTISGLDIGEYNVQAFDYRNESTFYISKWWDNVDNSWEATPVSITATGQNTPNINMQLELGSQIAGIIRKRSGEELTSEELSNLSIYAYSYTPEWPCQFWGEHYGTIQPDGSYSIQGIPSGNFRVLLKGNGTVNYIPAWSIGLNSSSQCDTLTGSIEISAPDTHIDNTNFQLDTGATISGTVTNDDNSPVSGSNYNVNLVDTSISDACDSWAYLGYMPIPTGGLYTISGIPPGDYSIKIGKAWQGPNIVEEWITGPTTDSSPDCLLAENINIPNTTTVITNRNFQVAPGGTISGAIYESDGITINTETHYIHFHESCDPQQWVAESSASCGNYTSQALLPGTYYVSLVDTDGTTTIGWLSPSGTPVKNCAEARAVLVEQDITTSGMDFILKPSTVSLTPVYFLLLDN